jgi:hypothetical protein
MKSLLVVLFLFSAQTVHAQQMTSVTDSDAVRAYFREERSFDETGIPFLTWSSHSALVKGYGSDRYTYIKGQFNRKILSATIDGRYFPVNPDGTFSLRIEAQYQTGSFVLRVTDSSNGVYLMKYSITSDVPLLKRAEKKWRYSLGTGFSLVNYRQLNGVSFGESAITVKAGIAFRVIPQTLDLGLNAFYNALVLSSDSPRGDQIQYLGVNFKAAYHLIDNSSPFKVNLSAGFYFNTSYGDVGFADMYGPQISPEFIYMFEDGDSIFFYGKYAYSLSESTGISLHDNREAAAGIHYSFPVGVSDRMSVGIDASQLSLTIANKWASTTSYSLSIGYSF